MRKLSALFMTCTLIVACDAVPADITDSEATDGAGNVVFTIVSGTTGSASGAALFAEAASGNVPMEAVAALDMTLMGLEVRQDGDGAWIEVPLNLGDPEDPSDDPVLSLDMLEIPEETPLVVAEGNLEPGHTYTDVRLWLSDATLELNEEVCLGPEDPADPAPVDLCVSGTVDAFFPSGDQTGVKTDAYFEVADEGQVEVTLVFDATASVASISWAPGLGQVVVSPVIRAADGTE